MKIILAVDDSPSSEDLLESVCKHKWPPETVFKIVTVLEPVCASSEDMTIAEFSHSARQIYLERRAFAERLCKKTCAKLESSIPGATIICEVKDGAPWVEVVKVASEWCADAIYVGAHGKDICPTNRAGSVGRAISDHSTCPVTVMSSIVTTRVQPTERASQ